jgi:hypothetical protein
MREVDEGVLKRELVFGQLLQSDDDPVLGRVLVCAFLDERRAYLLELLVLEDAGIVGVFGRALDQDRVASTKQLLCGGRCETDRIGISKRSCSRSMWRALIDCTNVYSP